MAVLPRKTHLTPHVLLAVGLGALAGVGCKPRAPGSEVRSGEGDGAGQYAVDRVAALEAAKVRAACEGKPGTFFRGTGAGDRVDFATKAEKGSEDEKTHQPSWYEEARFKDGKWRLSAAVAGRANGPECLRASTRMKTNQLIAALGCSNDDPCKPGPEVCTGSACLDTLAQADFSATSGGLEGRAEQGAMALAGGTNATCAKSGNGWQLKGSGGQAVGKPVDSEASCQALAATAREDVACGWTGHAFLPMRLSDGAMIGGGGDAVGTKTLKQCAALAATAKAGVACSLTKDGFVPFAVKGDVHALGLAQPSPDADDCAERIAVVEGGKACSWDKGGIQIFDAASGRVDAELGSFPSYKLCHGVIQSVKNAAGRAEYLAARKKAASTKVSDKSPEEGANGGMGLAGQGGWTWGDCNDANRSFHLTAQDSYGLICRNKINALYSWGPAAKIDWLATQGFTGRLVRDNKYNPIFTTQSSFATFGYGDYAIRFRVRSDAKWRFFDSTQALTACNSIAWNEIDNTIAVIYWNNGERTGVDYVLCSLGPIHSWSYGTQKHLLEIAREVAWVNTNNYKFYELYVKKNGVDDVFPDNLDGHAFNNTVLQNKANYHTALNPGRIFYNPKVQGQTEAWHFYADWSTYINP